jgi:hypothetical protein
MAFTSAVTVDGIHADCLNPSMLSSVSWVSPERLPCDPEPVQHVTTCSMLGAVLSEIDLAATLGVEDDPPDSTVIDDDLIVVMSAIKADRARILPRSGDDSWQHFACEFVHPASLAVGSSEGGSGLR